MDHLNQQALQALKEVMEDDFALLVNTFLQDSENRIKTLEALVNSDSVDAIRRTAHSFKGSCSNIGAPLLASYCAEIEKNAFANELVDIVEKLDQIKVEFATVKSLIKNV